jgi:hypothetical protein
MARRVQAVGRTNRTNPAGRAASTAYRCGIKTIVKKVSCSHSKNVVFDLFELKKQAQLFKKSFPNPFFQ